MTNDRLQSALSRLDQLAVGMVDPSQLLVIAKCRGLMAGYHARWKEVSYSVDEVEGLVTADLWNPETGTQEPILPNRWQAGRNRIERPAGHL